MQEIDPSLMARRTIIVTVHGRKSHAIHGLEELQNGSFESFTGKEIMVCFSCIYQIIRLANSCVQFELRNYLPSGDIAHWHNYWK